LEQGVPDRRADNGCASPEKLIGYLADQCSVHLRARRNEDTTARSYPATFVSLSQLMLLLGCESPCSKSSSLTELHRLDGSHSLVEIGYRVPNSIMFQSA
jgi:hypothetical protein